MTMNDQELIQPADRAIGDHAEAANNCLICGDKAIGKLWTNNKYRYIVFYLEFRISDTISRTFKQK